MVVMREYTFLIAVLSAATRIYALESTAYQSCGNGGGKILHVYVPCEQEPCIVHIGQNISVTVNCLPDMDASAPFLDVSSVILGLELALPGFDKNGCHDKNISCPIKKGEEIFYVGSLNLKSYYPRIDTIARFHLKTRDKDRNTRSICCAQMPVKIRS